MLSDELFEAREAILEAVERHKDYSGCRRLYIVSALANIELAMASLDTTDVDDDHIYGESALNAFIERAKTDFSRAVNAED